MELGLELRLNVKVTDLNYYYFLCYLIESATSVVTGYNVCVFKPTVHDPKRDLGFDHEDISWNL